MNRDRGWGRVVRGHTLIELLVVLALIAILAGMAWPAFGRQAMRAQRVDGQDLLLRAAMAQQRHHSIAFRYHAAPMGPGAQSSGGHYRLEVEVTGEGQGWRMRAEPVGHQQDDACGALTLDHLGRRGGDRADCW
jgi:type IV pilus assembly protein PilE